MTAWNTVPDADYDRYWSRFYETFDFHPGTKPETWPAIREPTPSTTFDISMPDGPRFASAQDAINAEALRAFVWALPTDTEMIVLNWQHPAYYFRPAQQAYSPFDWPVPVFPNGDYFIFLTKDFREGTFGHPWEETLCVMGERMVGSLGRSLRT
jgi:uncharacterized protein DUF2716